MSKNTSQNPAQQDGSSRTLKLQPPPNFESFSVATKNKPISEAEAKKRAFSYSALKEKRAWDLAISPAKSLPMNGFMLYMSGSSLQIFSIGILAMLLMNPVKAVASINNVFAPFAPTSHPQPKSFSTLWLQKLAYIACNLLTLGLGLYKCRALGLLPTGTGDWLAFETRGQPPELSF
ncbi:hypothetical protein FRB94_002673 [Tulasnella sp. JGI-2019a]|nr:hypothetical protein FRB93_002097 [Tulasnella sp. JGI-2019a]KAG9004082.1 hypothetical protein FRB94_002673 [Tulasnella sp. JGI-2019a]KAG9031378.1 hypothetical protein FRB95_002809 [Tulasnella sp. JGI-2019a]